MIFFIKNILIKVFFKKMALHNIFLLLPLYIFLQVLDLLLKVIYLFILNRCFIFFKYRFRIYYKKSHLFFNYKILYHITPNFIF